MEGFTLEQKHGKARVRVARVWRKLENNQEIIVEWNVNIHLLSDCIPAYVNGNNSDIVATDSMKNTVYVKAKECSKALSVEEFAILLGKHFTSTYVHLTGAIIKIVEKPWERILIDGRPHEHGKILMPKMEKWYEVYKPRSYGHPKGFKLGSEKHTTEVTVDKNGALRVTSGIEGMSVLKTTKSGFEGFIRDKYTLLPETRERIVATEVNALWRYSSESIHAKPICFTGRYIDVKKLLTNTFFGPPSEGVYSPSVQNTLYLMAQAVLHRFPDIEIIHLKMPNLHFLPVNLPNMIKFEHDVYVPTDEPHGTIEATLSRQSMPLSKI